MFLFETNSTEATMTTKILTFKTLKGLGACKDQLLRFKQLFGDKVNVTAELCNKHCNEFDWNWAAESLLHAPALTEYHRIHDTALTKYDRICATALAEYKSICAPAWEKYKRICDPALAEYKRIRAPALAEYHRIRDTAWAEYNRIRDTTLAKYNRVFATAWAELYINN